MWRGRTKTAHTCGEEAGKHHSYAWRTYKTSVYNCQAFFYMDLAWWKVVFSYSGFWTSHHLWIGGNFRPASSLFICTRSSGFLLARSWFKIPVITWTRFKVRTNTGGVYMWKVWMALPGNSAWTGTQSHLLQRQPAQTHTHLVTRKVASFYTRLSTPM